MVDPKDAARRFRLENEREARELATRRARAQEVGRGLAKLILEAHPEVGKVRGFGSTFEAWRNYRMTSDIDLAVESGDTMVLLDLVEDAEFPVDVVDLSSCRAPLADFIREHGIILAGEKG
jgi:predicted nucleotidyltransferase